MIRLFRSKIIAHSPAGVILLLFGILLVTGCDRVTRHKVLSTVFDGVPSLPPAEEYCEDYFRHLATDGGEEPDGESEEGPSGSRHKPYTEKNCKGCHDFQKESSLIRPPRELCFVCHQGFIQGAFVHGPVAVGDCLACHEPHAAAHPSLLKEGPSRICGTCHTEERLAVRMHDAVMTRGMNCVDCHDPHYGQTAYFLQ